MSVISTTSTRSGWAYFQIVGGELFRWQPVGMNSSRSVRGTGRRRTGFWQLFRQFTSNVSDHHTLLAAAGVAPQAVPTQVQLLQRAAAGQPARQLPRLRPPASGGQLPLPR